MNNIRDKLSLSSSERRGVVVLMTIIIVLVIIRFIGFMQDRRDVRADNIIKTEDLSDFEKTPGWQDDTTELQFDLPLEESLSAGLFYFDPNTITAADMKRLGLSTRLSKTIINYRMHGGRFRVKEDLLKIYGLDTSIYNSLSPYMLIAGTEVKKEVLTEQKKGELPSDINRADSAVLIKVKGIGPVLSRRILKYRELLGGFCSTGQLKEVYGLPDSLAIFMQTSFYADTSFVRRLNVNTASETELARHPYVGKYVAKGIVSYRNQVKRIQVVDELKKNGILTEEAFEKLKKYLTI
jgi:DNA uptake protein ComE-like DNA-binding protein